MALVRGDFGRLEDLRRRLGQVASPQFKEALARRLAGTVTKLLADEFRESRDPYGRPWAPVVRNRGRDVRARARRAAKGKTPRADKPLIDTGRLRAASIATAAGTSVRVVIPVEYASYHQYGTRRMPQRQIVPMVETGGEGPIWTAAFEKEIDLALRQAMAGSGGGQG